MCDARLAYAQGGAARRKPNCFYGITRVLAMSTKPGRVPLDIETPRPKNPPSPPAPPESPVESKPDAAGPADVGDLREKIVAALRTCFDPEIPVNIYEMGLI